MKQSIPLLIYALVIAFIVIMSIVSTVSIAGAALKYLLS